MARRDQLVELARREKPHRETTADKLLLRDLEQSLAARTRRREKIDARIAAHLDEHAALKARAARLEQAPGIGPVAAATLLAVLPERGKPLTVNWRRRWAGKRVFTPAASARGSVSDPSLRDGRKAFRRCVQDDGRFGFSSEARHRQNFRRDRAVPDGTLARGGRGGA